jgi:hypothetical protein
MHSVLHAGTFPGRPSNGESYTLVLGLAEALGSVEYASPFLKRRF